MLSSTGSLVSTAELCLQSQSNHHLLVASDTYLGNTCARIVADWLTANGIPNVQVCVIKNLVTDSLETFRFRRELVQWCEETLPESPAEHTASYST